MEKGGKQNGMWEPELREGCGSLAALVPMTAGHHKHKSTLEKIFKGYGTFLRL